MDMWTYKGTDDMIWKLKHKHNMYRITLNKQLRWVRKVRLNERAKSF